MDPKEQQQLNEAIKEARFAEFGREEIEGKMVFVASDETVDREGDVISIDGWELANFKRNPVMLWAHDPYQPPIGQWKNIRVRTINGKKKLTMEPDFHGKSELSRLIKELVESGYPPQTTSVGFRPYEKQGNTFTKQELLETSFVSIPANPEATTLALTKGYKPEVVSKLIENTEIEEKESQEYLTVRIGSLENEITHLKSQISKLEVAQAKPQSPKKATAKTRTKKLIQLADKALGEALRNMKD